MLRIGRPKTAHSALHARTPSTKWSENHQKCLFFSGILTLSANSIGLAEGVWSAKMLHLVAFLAFRQLLPSAECPGLSGAGQPVTLDQDFGDLHGVAGCPFAKIVRDHPEIEPVRYGWIPADPADKNFVPAGGVQR